VRHHCRAANFDPQAIGVTQFLAKSANRTPSPHQALVKPGKYAHGSSTDRVSAEFRGAITRC
jgi:hypothetical protein